MPEAAERLESGTVEAYPGVGTTFKITNRLRIIRDFDVEIAEASAIADPIVEAADEGFVIDLVPHLTMDGGKVVVEANVRRGEFDRPVRRFKLVQDRNYLLGTLDLPVFRETNAVATAVVTSGGEFTIPFVTGGKLILVRVKATVLGRGAGLDWLVDTGLMTRGQPRYMVGYDPEADEEYRARTAPRTMRLWDDDPYSPFGEVEELADLVLTHVDPWYWDEEGEVVFPPGGLLVLNAKPEVVERVHRFLAAREAEIRVPLRVDLEVMSVRKPVVSGVVDAMPERLGTWGAVSLSTLPGKEACAMLGRTRNYVADYDVEVAQSSKIADPIVGQSFAGIAANVLPRLAPDGSTVRLDLGLLFAHQTEVEDEGEKLEPHADYIGTLEQVPVNRRVFNTTLEVPRGSLYVFDFGPDPADAQRRLAVAVRVSGE